MNIRQSYELFEKESLSQYASKSIDSRGREKSEELCTIRTIYQQDKDRIIHSKSFRRLKHKTQVFISAYIGDHYRTRLTHTLEVAQISRTIARALRLNEDLAEAIALGHDLGHTPFGHSGERILNEISPAGFKHNEQSLRVVEILERKGEGLNLSHEVRDGILNHTGDNMPYTLEGKIVKLADRIAYINHDIDDGVRAGMLKATDIPEEFLNVLGFNHSERINTLVIDIIENSRGINAIKQSETVKDSMTRLRAFLFENLYYKKEIKGKMAKAENIIKMLYSHYLENLEDIEGVDYVLETSKERMVVDYISGMTDNYAIGKFEELFLP